MAEAAYVGSGLKAWVRRRMAAVLVFSYGLLVGTTAPILVTRCLTGGSNCTNCAGFCGVTLSIVPLLLLLALRNRATGPGQRLFLAGRKFVGRLNKYLDKTGPLFSARAGLWICLVACAAALLGLVALIACQGTPQSTQIELVIVPDSQTGIEKGAFSEEGCLVIRVTAYTESAQRLVLMTNKAKESKVVSLAFLELALPGNEQPASRRLLIAPVSEQEFAYDMTLARLYAISAASAERAAASGISYADWQTGVSNSSAVFPCCE